MSNPTYVLTTPNSPSQGSWSDSMLIPTTPTSAAGGDLSGSFYPNPLISAFQGNPLNAPDPLPGETLIWTGTEWRNENIQAKVLQFRGTWDASTDTPQIDNPASLTPPVLNEGDVWFVAVPGTYPLGNPPVSDWNVGDWAVFSGYNGTDEVWYKLENNNWTISGNAVDPADFLGSLNDQDVILKRFSQEKLRLVSAARSQGY